MRDYNISKIQYQRLGIDNILIDFDNTENIFIPPLSKTKFNITTRFNSYIDCKFGGRISYIQPPLPSPLTMFSLLNKIVSFEIKGYNLKDELESKTKYAVIFIKNPNGNELLAYFVYIIDIGYNIINFKIINIYGQNFNIPNDFKLDNIFIFQLLYSYNFDEKNFFAGVSEQTIPQSKSGIVFTRNSTDSGKILGFLSSNYLFITPEWTQISSLSGIISEQKVIICDFSHQLAVTNDYVINKSDGILQDYIFKDENYFILGMSDWFTSIPLISRHNRFAFRTKDFVSDGSVWFNVADFDTGTFEIDLDIPAGWQLVGSYISVIGDDNLRYQKNVNSSVDIIQTQFIQPGSYITGWFPNFLDVPGTKIVAAAIFKKPVAVGIFDYVVIFTDPIEKPKKDRFLNVYLSSPSIITRDNTVRHVNYYTHIQNAAQSMDTQTFIATIENPLPNEVIEEIWVDQIVSYPSQGTSGLQYPITFFSHYFDLKEAQIKNWPVLSINPNNYYFYYNAPIIPSVNFNNFVQNLNNQVFFLQNTNGKTAVAFRAYVPKFINKLYFNQVFFSSPPQPFLHFIKVTVKTNYGFLTGITSTASNISRINSIGTWTETDTAVIFETDTFSIQTGDLRLGRSAAIPYSGNDPDFSQYVDKNVNAVEQYINLGGGLMKYRVTFMKNTMHQKYMLIVRFSVYNTNNNTLKYNELSYYTYVPQKKRLTTVEQEGCKFMMPYQEGESLAILSFEKPVVTCNPELVDIQEYPNKFWVTSINAERDVCFFNLPGVKIVKEIPDNYLDITFDFWGSYDFKELPGSIWINLRLPGELTKISHDVEKETYVSKFISKVDVYRKTVDKYKVKLVLPDQVTYRLINEYLKSARFINVMPRKGIHKFIEYTLVIDSIDVEDMEGIMIFTITCSEIDAFDIYTYG